MQLIPHELNSQKSFIMGWYAEDTSFCDELIQLHENAQKFDGGSGVFENNSLVDKSIKDSTDTYHPAGMLAHVKYGRLLSACIESYLERYPEAYTSLGFGIKENWNIQHYQPGGGYHAWHYERANGTPMLTVRHLVFMTYLNDVAGGGTEFLFQDLKIQDAKKGLTLIWPADWTHTHRSIISPTSEKYIATGWTHLNDTRQQT